MKLDHPNANEDLEWYSHDDKRLEKYFGKIMFGFLWDSHREVVGIFYKSGHISITSYMRIPAIAWV